MVFRSIAFAVILVFLLLLTVQPILYSQGIGYYYSREENKFSIKTYFSTITFDLVRGGIVSGYTYGGTTILTARYFGPNNILDATLYEIIPVPTTPGGSSAFTWPGEVFRNKVNYTVVSMSTYRLIVESKIVLSSPTILQPLTPYVTLTKRFAFYYDKPYFEVEYIFENMGDLDAVLNLTSSWGRGTSFGIEIASAFGGDPEDDYQVYGTTDGDIYVYQAYNSSYLLDLEGRVWFIALVSNQNDYSIPQAIIVIPRGEAVNATLGVWFETVAFTARNIPHSLVARLEMKTFTLPRRSTLSFKYTVYMGPLAQVLLSELNLTDLAQKLSSIYRYEIPSYLPEYTVKDTYRVNMRVLTLRKSIPNATCQVFYVADDGSLESILNFSLLETAGVGILYLSKPGIYAFRVEPRTGYTADYNYQYSDPRVNGMADEVVYIPVYSDVDVTLDFTLKPIAWLNIVVVDETGSPLKAVENQPLTVEIAGPGFSRRYTINATSYKIRLDPGSYTITVKPREISGLRLTDVYLNDVAKTYRVSLNEVSFTVDLPGASQNTLLLRYVAVASPGAVAFSHAILIGLALVAAVLVFIIVLVLRGRRRI